MVAWGDEYYSSTCDMLSHDIRLHGRREMTAEETSHVAASLGVAGTATAASVVLESTDLCREMDA